MEPRTVRENGERLASADPWGVGSPRGTLWHDSGMTHLAILDDPGVDEPLDARDQATWANQQRCPSVQNGLTSSRTTHNGPVHGDAGRQWDRVSLSLPVTVGTVII